MIQGPLLSGGCGFLYIYNVYEFSFVRHTALLRCRLFTEAVGVVVGRGQQAFIHTPHKEPQAWAV